MTEEDEMEKLCSMYGM